MCALMQGRFKYLVAGLLFVLPVLAYIPSYSNGVIWDDDDYVVNNTNLRSGEGLVRMWTEPRSIPQYYPLVHTTYWIEYQLWGLDTTGYHVVNVLLHALGVLLLWRLLLRLGVPGATFAAALFALHPVHVETVAWITERKNVLSGALYLGAASAWFRFRPPEEERSGGVGWYALAFVLFAGALLSKTVTSTLPAALLVVTWWKRGRISWKRDVLPLLPFFAIGIALGLHTSYLERVHVGAQGRFWEFTLVERTLIAGRAVWFYASKIVWPSPLIFIYPRWEIDAGAALQYLFPAGAAAVVIGLWALRGRLGRGPLAAVLFFGGSLLPASGYFDVYPMRFSFVADHFQYLASLGVIVLLAAGAARLVQLPAARWVLGSLLLGACGLITWRQQADYVDVYTLWENTAKKNPDCWIAHDSLGLYAQQRGDYSRAVYHYTKATQLEPLEARSIDSLGTAQLMQGDSEAAIRTYRRAIELRPGFTMPRINLAAALAERGDVDEAAVHLNEAIRLEAWNVQAMVNLAKLEQHLGNHERARELAEAALKLSPEDPVALEVLGSL